MLFEKEYIGVQRGRRSTAKTKPGPFNKLRRQFDRRHQQYLADTFKCLADLSLENLADDGESRPLELTIGGALPPTTASRCARDVEKCASVSHTEAEAVRGLAIRQEAEEWRRIQRLAGETLAQRARRRHTAGKQMSAWADCEDSDSSEEDLGQSTRLDEYDDAGAAKLHWKSWENQIHKFHCRGEEVDKFVRDSVQTKAQRILERAKIEPAAMGLISAKHRRAEAQLAHQSRRQMVRENHRKYMAKLAIAGERVAEEGGRLDAQCKEAIWEGKVQKVQRKVAKETMALFTSKLALVTMSADKMDTAQRREQWRQEAKCKVENLKVASDLRHESFRQRDDIFKAEYVQRLENLLMRERFARETVQDRRQAEVRNRHDAVQREKSFKRALQELAEDIVAQQIPVAPDDIKAYETMLDQVRRLADSVREHSVQIIDAVRGGQEPPPTPEILREEAFQLPEVRDLVTPKVFDVLSKGRTTCDSTRADGLTELSVTPYGGHSDGGTPLLIHDLLHPYLPQGPRTGTAPGRPRRHRLPVSEAEASPRAATAPPSSRTERAASQHRAAQPFPSVLERPSSCAAGARIPAARKDAGSLSALRQVRRTGPLIMAG